MMHTIRRAMAIVAVVSSAGAMGGCLEKETVTTIALEPDGSGAWEVVDRHVRASGDTAAERAREEREYLAAADAGRHGPALALAAIGCADVTTRVLRREWPYTVGTSCRFGDLGLVFHRLLDRSGFAGESWLEKTASDRVTWHFTMDLREESKVAEAQRDDDRPLEVLLSGKALQWFLHEGRFVEATGFDIEEEGRVATMKEIEDEEVEKAGGVLMLTLTWTVKER